MSDISKRIKTSIIDENPTFISFLALCPTLGATNNVKTAFGMGVTVLIVVMCTNVVTSSVRKLVTSNTRIPIFITLIASIVTVMEMVMEAYLPTLYSSLGILLPLVVVNCIILGRAEAYAVSNTVFDSFIDAVGTGLAFTLSLTLLGCFRELLGTGGINLGFVNIQLLPPEIMPSIFTEGPGAFIAFGLLTWMVLESKAKIEKKIKDNKKAQLATAE
jgi:Na+-translocating ferredoxin:NAD+ oxidoreductase subunit E